LRNNTRYSTTRGINVEWSVRHQFGIPQVSSEDSQTVSTFLRFGTIGIDDSEPKGGARLTILVHQNTIRPDTEVSVADPLGELRGEWRLAVRGTNDEVIISESVVAVEFHGL
jgi:hypothetical protein